MPATQTIFSCGIWSFSTTLKNDASTAKSPQAGHQVGWSALSCFLVSFSVEVLMGSGAGELQFWLRILSAPSWISRTRKVRPWILLSERMFGLQVTARSRVASWPKP